MWFIKGDVLTGLETMWDHMLASAKMVGSKLIYKSLDISAIAPVSKFLNLIPMSKVVERLLLPVDEVYGVCFELLCAVQVC